MGMVRMLGDRVRARMRMLLERTRGAGLLDVKSLGPFGECAVREVARWSGAARWWPSLGAWGQMRRLENWTAAAVLA